MAKLALGGTAEVVDGNLRGVTTEDTSFSKEATGVHASTLPRGYGGDAEGANGAPLGIRTRNLRIKSPLLCR